MPPFDQIRSIIAAWFVWRERSGHKAPIQLAPAADPELAHQRALFGVRLQRGMAVEEYAKARTAHRRQRSAWRRLNELTHDELRLRVGR